MFSRAITLTTRTGSSGKALCGQPQPLFERDEQPERTGDVRDSWADVTRARELLGWEPRIGLEEGLRLAAEFFLQRTALA